MAELEERLGTVHDAASRLRLVQALGEVPGDDAGNVLNGLVSDPDPTVAGTARYLSQAASRSD